MIRSGRVKATRAAVLVGLLVSFVAAVDLIRWLRPSLLLDPEPRWAVPRFLLGLFVIGAVGVAGGVAAVAFFRWVRRPCVHLSPACLPFGRAALLSTAVGALVVGALLRFAALDRLPRSLWIDDLSLIAPALALQASTQDLADSVRPNPYGLKKAFGSVGVLYLELYRLSLKVFGTTVVGVRFLFPLAGTLSLITASRLGRELLPRGGGALTGLILAGLRWHLILSRWSYAIVIAPLVDLATLLLLRSRRKQTSGGSFAGGISVGLATHVYLSSWIAAVALLGFALWPGRGLARSLRIRLGFSFLIGFLAAVSPLFLLRSGRAAPYFARTRDHNVRLEISRTRSWLPPFAAAADALASPWFLADPTPRHDLPGRSRLGILGIPLGIFFARALRFPREDLSALLLTHAGAALAASVAGGQADLPNGFRFVYLASITAVAAAGGILWLLRLVPKRSRHAAAIAALGLTLISGALAARDVFWRWGESRATFDGFYGQDSMVARAALRWERFGAVEIARDVGFAPFSHSPITIGAIRRYRVDPEDSRWAELFGGVSGGEARSLRIVKAGTPPQPGEKSVEHIRDAWGRQWAVVLARRW